MSFGHSNFTCTLKAPQLQSNMTSKSISLCYPCGMEHPSIRGIPLTNLKSTSLVLHMNTMQFSWHACVGFVCAMFMNQLYKMGTSFQNGSPIPVVVFSLVFPPITPLLSLSSSTLKQERSDHNFMLSLMTGL